MIDSLLDSLVMYFKENPNSLSNLIITIVLNTLFNAYNIFNWIYKQYAIYRFPLKKHEVFSLYNTVNNNISSLEFTMEKRPIRAKHIVEWQKKANDLIIEFCHFLVKKGTQRKNHKNFNFAVHSKMNDCLNEFEQHVKLTFLGEKNVVRLKFSQILFPAQERIKLDIKKWLESNLDNYQKSYYILSDLWKYFELHVIFLTVMADINGSLSEYESKLEQKWKDLQTDQ